jgi:hypothetical protein
MEFMDTHNINPLKAEKRESNFYPVLPDFLKNTAFCKVPMLQLFAALVRVTCRRRDIGSMIMTGETHITGN